MRLQLFRMCFALGNGKFHIKGASLSHEQIALENYLGYFKGWFGVKVEEWLEVNSYSIFVKNQDEFS